MEKESKHGKMEANSKAFMKIRKSKAMENILGQMKHFMTANGITIKKMAKDN